MRLPATIFHGRTSAVVPSRRQAERRPHRSFGIGKSHRPPRRRACSDGTPPAGAFACRGDRGTTSTRSCSVTPRSERDRSLPAYERGGVRAARLRAIKVDIGKHLCEPALSLDMIAMRQGISPRYVRKLFQEEQTTFSDFVLLLRLERSRQLLHSPAQAISTIALIAHACGFNDLSYFNRTFRRRYGTTPTDFRNGVL